jgi:spoIIIJ-associated protein
VTQDPVVTQRENVVAVTEDDSAGPPPAADRAGTDEAVEPAGEPAGEARDVGGAAQADAHDAPSEQDGQDEPGGRDEPSERDKPGGQNGPGEAAASGTAADAGAVAADEDDEAEEDEEADEDEEAPSEPGREVADLEQEQEIAADYLEGLLDIVGDPDSEFDMGVEGDRALVSVVGGSLRELVGPRGEVLEALQELTRLAVHRQTGVRTRLMLDVGGYRARRRMELTALGRDAAEDVSRTGVARRLEAMTPFERKIVHDAVAAAGLRSESEGEEPNRRVVVLPAG